MSGVWPGPPLKLWSTSERALVASANGPPASLAGMTTVSWTKKLPVGVGVEVLTFVLTKLTLLAIFANSVSLRCWCSHPASVTFG